MEKDSRIILDASVLAGKPVIRGTRIPVELVLDLLASGWDASQIIQEYPGISREDILSCLRYAQELVASERVYCADQRGRTPSETPSIPDFE